MGLVVFGTIGDFIALGLAPQSIVAPIGATTLIANIVFGHFFLKENLGRRDLIGTALIIVGSIICALFGDHSEKSYDVSTLISFYGQPGFIVYAIICVGSIGSLYYIARLIEPIKVDLLTLVQKFEAARLAGDRATMLKTDSELCDAEEKYSKWEKVHPIVYCALSGLFGGQNILFGKMVAELLRQTMIGNNQMGNWVTYLFIFIMFSTIFCQLNFLAKALSYFDVLFVVPLFQCFFILTSTVAGGAYFSEFAGFSLEQALVFPLGIICTLIGVKILSTRKMSKYEARDLGLDPNLLTATGSVKNLVSTGAVRIRQSLYASGKRASALYRGSEITSRASQTLNGSRFSAGSKENSMSRSKSINPSRHDPRKTVYFQPTFAGGAFNMGVVEMQHQGLFELDMSRSETSPAKSSLSNHEDNSSSHGFGLVDHGSKVDHNSSKHDLSVHRDSEEAASELDDEED